MERLSLVYAPLRGGACPLEEPLDRLVDQGRPVGVDVLRDAALALFGRQTGMPGKARDPVTEESTCFGLDVGIRDRRHAAAIAGEVRLRQTGLLGGPRDPRNEKGRVDAGP